MNLVVMMICVFLHCIVGSLNCCIARLAYMIRIAYMGRLAYIEKVIT